MNIVILGAGSIGSLFGGLLSRKNTVILVGRPPHVTVIQKSGLKITGKTRISTKISAVDTIEQISLKPDLLILTVKSYDTDNAIKQARPLLTDNTVVLSLQNGLDNCDIIQQYIDQKHIIAGVTTHGAIFSQPGLIHHTGSGKTIIGELDGAISERISTFVHLFQEAGIETQASDNILREIWQKAIVNSSINPLTAFFSCKNGYLLENPLLEKIVEMVCQESTDVAISEGIAVSYPEMMKKTRDIINETAENSSSMLQSVRNHKKTEIDAINGSIITIGKNHNVDVSLNQILVQLIQSLV